MKVKLDHSTAKVGIFKSAPVIQLTVEFSDAEQEIIKRSGLAPKIFYEAPLHNHFNERMQGPTPVSQLVNGKQLTFHFQDEATARVEETNIKTSLKTLKDAIESMSAPVQKSQNFEL
jgi:hypothetical protein